VSNITPFDNYFPFDQGIGATASPGNWRLMARNWSNSGVVYGYASNLSCAIATGVITIQPGAVWIDGFYGQLNNPKTYSVAGLTYPGLLCAQLDMAQRTVSFVYVAGTTPPVNTPGANQWTVPLYQVNSTTAIVDIRTYHYANIVPCGKAVGTANTNLPATDNQWVQIALTSSFVRGGASVGASLLSVPVTGIYRVSFGMLYGAIGAGRYIGSVYQTLAGQPMTTKTEIIRSDMYTFGASYPNPGKTALVPLNAHDVISLWAYKTNGNVAVGIYGVPTFTWLDAEWVSQ